MMSEHGIVYFLVKKRAAFLREHIWYGSQYLNPYYNLSLKQL